MTYKWMYSKLSYKRGCQEKSFPLPSAETWMFSFASSPVSVLGGVLLLSSWARRVFPEDQPS